MTTVTVSLKEDVQIDSVTCYTDSKVSLYWIKGLQKEWKSFVPNRVNAGSWCHPISGNTVLVRTTWQTYHQRGLTPTELVGSILWLHGPSWLNQVESQAEDKLLMKNGPSQQNVKSLLKIVENRIFA